MEIIFRCTLSAERRIWSFIERDSGEAWRVYGELPVVRRADAESRLDHGGRFDWEEIEGESRGEMGRARAFAVEL